MKTIILRIALSLAAVMSAITIGAVLWLITNEEQGVIDVQYTFEGNHAATAGFAEGTITLTPTADTAATEGYYLLYFADDRGLLDGYDELASVPITGDTVTHTVKNGTLLPPAATKLAVFEAAEPFLDTPPAYDTRAGVFPIPQDKRLRLDEPSFSFAAVADVHMNYEAHNRGAYQKWEDALNTFAAMGMDRVIVAGDMTGDEFEGTLTKQYETYLDIIDRSEFPLAHIHEAIGNHGNTEIGRRQFVYYTSGKGEERPFEGSPWFSVRIRGEEGQRDNLFLFMAQELTEPGVSAKCDNFSEEQIDWVEEMLKKNDNPDTNIFIVEHSPFLNYGPGDRHPDGSYTSMITFKYYFPQTMRLKRLLETHKRVILLSGHTHLSLYDNENYSDEGGTSCRMIHISSTCHPKTYRNAEKTFTAGDGRYAVSPSYGSEAYTVRVYRDYILFTGHNLTTDRIIPSACYILPTTL